MCLLNFIVNEGNIHCLMPQNFLTSWDFLIFQLLLAYAGSASNVRVERASRDCFRGGGALAEVMSLYENRGAENLSNNENLSSEVLEKGNFRSGIEV